MWLALTLAGTLALRFGVQRGVRRLGGSRLVTALSGPITHVALAFLLAVLAYRSVGVIDRSLVVREVLAGGPAERDGLRNGERIVAVDGDEDVVGTLHLELKRGPTRLALERAGETRELVVTPDENGRIGAWLQSALRPPGWAEAFARASRLPGELFQTRGELTGPVGVLAVVDGDVWARLLAGWVLKLGLLLLAYDIWLAVSRGAAAGPLRR